MKKVTKVFKKMSNMDPMIWGYVMFKASEVYALTGGNRFWM